MKELVEFVHQLRGLGVRVYKGEFEGKQVEVELGPPLIPDPPASKEVDEDKCKCGHASHEHQNGLCLRGCAPDECVDAAKMQ